MVLSSILVNLITSIPNAEMFGLVSIIFLNLISELSKKELAVTLLENVAAPVEAKVRAVVLLAPKNKLPDVYC